MELSIKVIDFANQVVSLAAHLTFVHSVQKESNQCRNLRDAIRYAVNKVHSIDTTAEIAEEFSIINSIKFMRSADVSIKILLRLCVMQVSQKKKLQMF